MLAALCEVTLKVMPSPPEAMTLLVAGASDGVRRPGDERGAGTRRPT